MRINLENFYAKVTFVSYIIFQLSQILCFKNIPLCERHLGIFSSRGGDKQSGKLIKGEKFCCG